MKKNLKALFLAAAALLLSAVSLRAQEPTALLKFKKSSSGTLTYDIVQVSAADHTFKVKVSSEEDYRDTLYTGIGMINVTSGTATFNFHTPINVDIVNYFRASSSGTVNINSVAPSEGTGSLNFFNGVSGQRGENMFYADGVLKIIGTADCPVVIDGGAGFSGSITPPDDDHFFTTDLYAAEPDKRFYNCVVAKNLGANGQLRFDYVTIRNVRQTYSTESYGGAAVVHGEGTNYTSGTLHTTLNNCTIEYCASRIACGVYMNHFSLGQVDINDCEFRYCSNGSATSNTYRGVVRTIGNSRAKVYIKNCVLHHNYSGPDSGCGSALTVNGTGAGSTVQLDGCKFYRNYAKWGGAIFVMGNIEFANNKTTVYNNEASEEGGGVYLRMYNAGAPPASAVTITQELSDFLEVYGNTAKNGGGVTVNIQSNGSLTTGSSYNILFNGASIHDNTCTGNGAGFYYLNQYEGTDYTLDATFASGSIYNNTNTGTTSSAGQGGGVYVGNAKTLKFTGGDIYSNTARVGGGAFITGSDFNFSNGKIRNNISSDSGGGVYVESGNVKITDGAISENTAGNLTDNKFYGGGLYVEAGDVNISGGSIGDNTAAYGGAIALYGNLNITNGTIKSNTAELGGAVYLNKAGVLLKISGGTVSDNYASGTGGGIRIRQGKVEIEGGTVSGNTAGGNGGGIWITGQYDTATRLVVNNGKITGNSAVGDGGGVYLEYNAPFTMAGGEISTNTAVNGAGVYTDGQFTFSRGYIISNTASGNGGGLYGKGAEINFTNGTLNSNKAVDGGGVYLTGGAEMSYNNGGYICFNEASHRGGGIFLKASGNTSEPTFMNFVVTGAADEELGLYSNIASDAASNPEGAGDDIYAEGGSTKVIVPDISAMKLDGYSSPGVILRWYEDYSYDDPRYSEGTAKGTETGYSGKRYRKERDLLHPIYYVLDIASNEAYRTKYLALTMGFEFKSLAIRRKGLCPGEQAIYLIEGPAVEGTPRYRQRVVIYGTDATWDSVSVDINGLPSGDYTVTETSWAWYNENAAGSIAGPLTQSITDNSGTLFTFINTHSGDYGHNDPLHDEQYKSNTLK